MGDTKRTLTISLTIPPYAIEQPLLASHSSLVRISCRSSVLTSAGNNDAERSDYDYSGAPPFGF